MTSWPCHSFVFFNHPVFDTIFDAIREQRPPASHQNTNAATQPPHLWKQDFNYMAEWCLSSTTKGRSGWLGWKRSRGETERAGVRHPETHTLTKPNIAT